MRAGIESGSRAALACALALLAGGLVPGAAGAAAPRTVAGYGSGPGKVNTPVGVAVDQASGDLYVADNQNYRVDRFDSEGNFLLAWGWGVADGKSLELQACGPAAEPPTRRCFEAAEEGSNGAHDEDGPGAVKPVSVAVDPSSHDVYVADSTLRRVTKFTPSGEFLFMVGKEVDKTTGADICRKEDVPPEGTDECGKGGAGGGPGEFESPASLAIDGSGRVWVGDSERISSFDPDGSPGPEVELPEAGETPSLAVDSGGDFYVAREEIGERQQVSFEGFATGDTFKIGNLPAACESSSTDAIEYSGGGITRNLRMQGALEAACGAGGFEVVAAGGPTASKVTFAGALAGVDDPLVSCAAVSGAGSCPVTPISDGVPGEVERLEAGTGAPIGALDEGGFPRAIAIDGEDHLYVGDAKAPYRLIEYDSEGDKVSQFGAGQVIGEPTGNALALDEGSEEPGDERPATLYAASSRSSAAESAVQAFDLPGEGPLPDNQRAEDILPTEATLEATLNPEGGETIYRFEYGTSEAYGSETPTPPRTLEEEGSPDEGFEDRPVSATLKGLIPATTYHFRLCASSSAGENCGPDTTFRTRTAVGIEAQWVSALSAREASLDATLDPLGAGNAFWWVEYDTSPYGEAEAGHGTRTPEAPLPPSTGALHRAAPLVGLAPNTTYHYRFVARGDQDNHPYTVHGPDRAFTTQPAGLGLSLPDDRAWEMVSPPEMHGARLRFPSEGQVQAAANGEALAYLSRGSIEADPEGSRSPEDTSVLGRRTGAGQWASQDITPPNAAVVNAAVGFGLEYKLFSPNLVEALLEPRSGTSLAPSASERAPYLRQNSEPPAYTPLVSGCPPEGQACPPAVAAQADVPAGTEFGVDPTRPVNYPLGAVRIAGSSADLAHVVLKSSVSLTCYETPETGRWNDSACSDENAEHEGDWESAPAGALYEGTAGRLEPLSVRPGKGVAVVSAELGSGVASVRGAISADGSRVFWTSSSGAALYVRDTALGQTVRLDAEQPGAFGTGEAEPVFQGANEAGTVAFFTDTQNLTEDANESGADLYRCEVVVEGGTLKCDLTDLTAQTHNPADLFESAEVQGIAAGMSEDATRAYLVARGVLDATANPRGESAVPGQPNLYLWRQGSGTRFIAALSEQDFHDWGVVKLKPEKVCCFAVQLTAGASPSGRYLAFMSEASLTGYDNRDASSGEADQEVFLYDSDEDRLICASCDPAGARPRGLRGFEGGGLAPAYDPQGLWAKQPEAAARPLAAVLPDATKIDGSGASLYRPRAIDDNGRLFFNAADSLVGADSNGNWDVYEYEPLNSQAGAAPSNTCTPSSGGAATARSGDGCVSLISSGTAEGESAFVDASVGGNDVFFWTNAQLSVNDVDHVTDVYDARVDGTPATLDPLAECQGEACQPPATPPPYTAGATATHHGPGNLKGKGAASRCTAPARGAKRLSRRARRLRRAARRVTRKGNPRKARRLARRSRRLARHAGARSKRAKRCRRRARAQQRSRR